MKKAFLYISGFLMLTLLLACGISLGGVDEEATQMAEMQQTMDHLGAAATSENGQDEPAEPETEGETLEDQEQQPSPTSTWRAAPCNRAELVSETIPDGTVMSPGQTFTKTWEIRNTGTCTWTGEYRIVFNIGHKMNGFTEKYLSQDVDPGEILNVTANLTANSAEGDYKGTYKLKAPDGTAFIKFWTDIIVEAEGFDIEPIEPLPDLDYSRPLGGFIVSNMAITITEPTHSGPCPHSFKLKICYKVEGEGQARYNLRICDPNNQCGYLHGQTHPVFNFDEDQIGQSLCSPNWGYQANKPGTYTVSVVCFDPYEKIMATKNFTCNCTN